jgi:tagatose 1,6-diphosphate aldolase
VTLAGVHGANYCGILGGRATWRDGVQVYADGGKDALIDWLDTQGRENINELNDILSKYAKPWYEIYGGLDNIEVFDIDVMK